MSSKYTALVQDDDNDDDLNWKDMVWFHGKELGKSLMKSQSNLVRLGIGQDGVYKLDSKTAKVIKHWSFREIKDCNYSGFSFTLTPRSGADYFVRTDDGEAICAYIESFQKDPAAALEKALANPPMSQVPDSGVQTLRRKFNSSNPKSTDVRYFTLNRRSKKADPIKDCTTNIDVDSRLRARSSLVETRSTTLSLEASGRASNEKTHHKSLDGFLDQTSVNGVSKDEKIWSPKIDLAAPIEKRHSNGIVVAPVSTKGESTMTQSTKSSPLSTSPLTERKKFNRVNKSPSPVVATYKPGEKQKDIIAPRSKSTKPSVMEGEKAPLLRSGSTTSSEASFEYKIIRQGPNTSRESSKEPDRLSNISDDAYDRLEAFVGDRPASYSGSTDVSRSGSRQRSVRSGSEERASVTASPAESEGSGIYDHLPPALAKSAPSEQRNNRSPAEFLKPRRMMSSPALGISDNTGIVERGRSSSSPVAEESSDEPSTPTNSDSEIKIGQDEGQIHFEQVKLREKKHRSQQDPFAELLSPTANQNRLRWSQELNPLYDYIKGFKVSDGVKLYDNQPSKLTESSRASDLQQLDRSNSKPGVIMEEESEYMSSREETVSPSDTTLYSPTPSDISRPTSSFSESPMSPTNYSKKPHLYEEIMILSDKEEVSPPKAKGADLLQQMQLKRSVTEPVHKRHQGRSATLNLGLLEGPGLRAHDTTGRSPRIGKRELQQQRKSRTIHCSTEEPELPQKKQKPVRASDELKDFSLVMREYRLFFIKLPNGVLHRQIFSITKLVSELKDILCDLLGVDNSDHYLLYAEGACLTTVKETDTVAGDGIVRSGSLNHLVDSQSLPDQGAEPILLKSNLSLKLQGVSTSRIMNLVPDDEAADTSYTAPSDIHNDVDEDFSKDWLSIVQGLTPVGQDDAVKLAALQYQSYYLDRTAVHSTVGFCRPTEFLPVEYASVRGLEHKMYREQESLKSLNHRQVHEAYTSHCQKLATYNAVFFPAREPRKKLLQSTKLKPVLLGVNSKGILRIDLKTKEVLDFWEFTVLKNWAYSKRTFVLAFANKNYPVECNQSRWISQLVDFYVDSIVINDAATGLPPENEA